MGRAAGARRRRRRRARRAPRDRPDPREGRRVLRPPDHVDRHRVERADERAGRRRSHRAGRHADPGERVQRLLRGPCAALSAGERQRTRAPEPHGRSRDRRRVLRRRPRVRALPHEDGRPVPRRRPQPGLGARDEAAEGEGGGTPGRGPVRRRVRSRSERARRGRRAADLRRAGADRMRRRVERPRARLRAQRARARRGRSGHDARADLREPDQLAHGLRAHPRSAKPRRAVLRHPRAAREAGVRRRTVRRRNAARHGARRPRAGLHEPHPALGDGTRELPPRRVPALLRRPAAERSGARRGVRADEEQRPDRGTDLDDRQADHRRGSGSRDREPDEPPETRATERGRHPEQRGHGELGRNAPSATSAPMPRS